MLLPPQPSLLLLDEPTTGLDPQSRHDLGDAINRLNKKDNMTVVLITHYLEEMAGCDILHVLISAIFITQEILLLLSKSIRQIT